MENYKKSLLNGICFSVLLLIIGAVLITIVPIVIICALFGLFTEDKIKIINEKIPEYDKDNISEVKSNE